MNINKEALKGIVEEIEASRARQKAETELQREIMKRCKPHQLEPKAVRIVLQRRAMGDAKREEQDYYVHAYELALGPKKQAADALASGKGVRETARATGLSVGTVSAIKKSVQKSSQLNTPHDPETGEIKESEVAVPPGDGEAPASNDAAGTPSPSIDESCGGEVKALATSPAQGPVVSEPDETRPAVAGFASGTSHEQGNRPLGVAPEPQDTDPQSAAMDRMVALGQEIDADDLAIPPFLRGSRQRVAA